MLQEILSYIDLYTFSLAVLLSPENLVPWDILKANTIAHTTIHAMAGYQALLQVPPVTFLTNIAPLPIIPRPVSEWETIYSALKIAQAISAETIGHDRKTTVTLDLALYEKAVQLTESDPSLRNKFNLRLGEFHVVKAHLS